MQTYSTVEEVLARCRELEGLTLKQLALNEEWSVETLNKGSVGHLIEEAGFGVSKNSSPHPDLEVAGVEVKAVPLKMGRNQVNVKERTKVCSLDYFSVVKEAWTTSHCFRKINRMVLIFFEHRSDDRMSGRILGHLLYDLSREDRASDTALLEHDWLNIQRTVVEGRAHELSESLTGVLAASTTGQGGGRDFVEQPYSQEPAKRRAFSLKPSYTGVLWREIRQPLAFDTLASAPTYDATRNPREFLLARMQPYIGLSLSDISRSCGVALKSGKAASSGFVRAILGMAEGTKAIREFEALGIRIRVFPVEPVTHRVKESISFPHQPLAEILEDGRFENSMLAEWVSEILFIPVYRSGREGYEQATLGTPFFWSPDDTDCSAMQAEFARACDRISTIQQTFKTAGATGPFKLLPASETSRIHLRPHGRNARDTDSSIGPAITKQSFWLNARFIGQLVSRQAGNPGQ
jgi:DNA mismatch repair protein MutH